MKKYSLSLAFLALFCWSSQPASSQVSNDNEDGVNKVDQRFAKDFVPGQVLVKMKDGSPASVRRNARGKFQSAGLSQLDAVLKEFGVENMEQLLPHEKPKRQLRKAKAYNGQTIQEHDLSQLYLLEMDADHVRQTTQLVERLNAISEVDYAEPNYKVYITDATIADSYDSNPFVMEQWYLDDYGVKELWDKPVINSKRPVIAIIDTGVDMTHPDLVDNLWTNTAEAEGEEGYDNDGNGFVGDVHGWDFVNNTPNVRDFNMHGTHVAGIAAAANNDTGIVGANPKALIMPISVMQSDGTGDVATIVKGINYAAQNGADVLNLSLGTYTNSHTLRYALEKAYQSAVIVAAAGNDDYMIYYQAMFPAAYSFVLGVQAENQNKLFGKLAQFSNTDPDGPNYSEVSTFQDPDGFNYELSAPGVNILSTIPGGKYKVLRGTSMAAPLVAGAISALKMVKEYDTQELLWCDLLHSDNIAEAFAINARPAELDMVKVQLQDRKDLEDESEQDYGGDNEIDAGEIVSVYPVIRSTFGEANNIHLRLEMGDFEDPNTVQILTGEADFGMHLDAYGKDVSRNPLVMKVASNLANGRHIKLKVVATCDETTEAFEKPFTIVVNNMKKIGGVIAGDMTLTANHEWLVTSGIGIPEGVTLTIEPGTKVLFNDGVGINSSGTVVAQGTKEKPIILTKNVGQEQWAGIFSSNNNAQLIYCKIEYSNITDYQNYTQYNHCIFTECNSLPLYGSAKIRNSNIQNCDYYKNPFSSNNYVLSYSNIVNNLFRVHNSMSRSDLDILKSYNNCFNTLVKFNDLDEAYMFYFTDATPKTYSFNRLPYMGSSKESIVRSVIYESQDNTYGWLNLDNMPDRPYAEAHGVVWKVCVNGKDAQDEFEDLAPLGVGTHKFEVYFNRPMNKEVTPQISFGVRDPYTQNAVAEDGFWNEEGTIYTAYKTITGKTKSDGLNRVYVYGAEDDEFFECPYEKTRFNIMINAAGSMATGFAAEANLGRVDLTWDNSHNDFDDAMGFNIYRYQLDSGGNKVNNQRINQEIVDIETTEYTDYDVVPGQTYYYMYKVLSTDLKEFDASNVVAATPLTSELGDANGSGDVDVADVITTVNQITGMEPKPFIFEAADVNVDKMIDVLDVIGIIQKILNPDANTFAMSEVEATYTIEDGTLYVESPVALAGVQVQLSGTSCQNDNGETINDKYTVAADLDGFEHTSAWLSDNDYLFLAYNMNGKTLSPGKHALLYIGDAMIAQMRLSDANGHNILVNGDDATKVNRMASDVMTIPGIYDMQGRKLSGNTNDVKLPKGVYIINGQKVVR